MSPVSSRSNAEYILIKFTSPNYTPYSLAFHSGPTFSLVLGNISKKETEQKQSNRYVPRRSSASVMVVVIINNMKKIEKRNIATDLASIIFTSKQKGENIFSIHVIQERIIRTGIFGMGRVDITSSREKKPQSFHMNIKSS